METMWLSSGWSVFKNLNWERKLESWQVSDK